MGSPLCDHLARLCLQCDWILQSKTVNNHDHSRIPLCTNCVLETAVVQCLDQGLCLCQTCVLNPNYITSRFFLLRNGLYNSSAYNPLDLDHGSSSSSSSSSLFNLNRAASFASFPLYNEDSYLDLGSSSSSSSSSLFNRNRAASFASFPLYNEDSSSSFEIFENYRKNSRDQQVPMLQPHYLHTPKDSSCSSFNGYDTKEDIENVLLNTFDCDEAVLDQKEYTSKEDLILTDQLIDEITKTTRTEILSSSSSGMSSVIHKDYNIEGLANASCQDYYKHQMIGSKGKEETNNFGIFSNALVQLDCGLTDEMLPREEQKSFKRSNLQDREQAKKRYFAKKTKRKFGKQIRYESRKSTADTKRRMKGRFTKAGAEYDYGPRANNNNKGTNKIMS